MKNRTTQIKKILISFSIVTAFVVLLNACKEDTTLKQQEIPISGEITRIYIEGPWDVIITQDSTNNSAVLEYDVPEKNIKTEYSTPGILRVKVYEMDGIEGKVLRLRIKATALLEIEALDGAKIQTSGIFRSYSDVYLSGASQLNEFWCEDGHIKLILSGASEINNLTYIGSNFHAHIIDGSKVNLQNIQMSSCSGCQVKLFNRSEFSGSGRISCTPSFFGVDGSVFKTFDIELASLDVDFSGGVFAEVTASHEIKGKLSWGSKLKYKKATNISDVSVDEYSEIIKIE